MKRMIVNAAASPKDLEKRQAFKDKTMSFQDWLDWTFYDGFAEASSGLSDEEYYELEDMYHCYLKSSTDITASTMLPPELEDYYGVVSLQDLVDKGYLPDIEDAEEMDQEQREMAEAYDAEVLGYAIAKERYVDALADNGLDFITLVREDGRIYGGVFVNGRLMLVSENELYNSLGDDYFEDLDDEDFEDVESVIDIECASPEDLQKKFAEYMQKQNEIGKQLDDLQSDVIKKSGLFNKKKKVTADVWDDISQVDQEFTSENTSINSTKLPAIFKMIKLPEGSVNVDVGGGKFDNVAEYLAPLGVVNLVYDPYNRSAEHNQQVIQTLKEAGGADSGTCSNVLNVIKEPEARLNVLKNMSRMVKPGGDIYITVYEGTGKGDEGETKSGYQLNRKTADYLDEIRQVFPNADRKGKLIVATN